MSGKIGRKRRNDVLYMILCVLASVCLCGGYIRFRLNGAEEKQTKSVISLMAVSADSAVTMERAKEMHEWEETQENPLPFTAWEKTAGRAIAAQDKMRWISDVTVISMNGSSEYLFPCGKILHSGDKTGCLIGEKTAELLFQSHQVEGLSLWYGERELTIRGILPGEGNLLAVQETRGDAVFSGISFPYGKEMKSKRLAAENFQNRYGLAMVRMDNRGKFPSAEELAELVPGKWSDFSGWKQNFAAWKKERERDFLGKTGTF